MWYFRGHHYFPSLEIESAVSSAHPIPSHQTEGKVFKSVYRWVYTKVTHKAALAFQKDQFQTVEWRRNLVQLNSFSSSTGLMVGARDQRSRSGPEMRNQKLHVSCLNQVSKVLLSVFGSNAFIALSSLFELQLLCLFQILSFLHSQSVTVLRKRRMRRKV